MFLKFPCIHTFDAHMYVPNQATINRHILHLMSNRSCIFTKVEIGRCSKYSNILLNMVSNLQKSTYEAVLEHVGDPLGAKVAQERQCELKNLKKCDFRVLQ